MADQKKGPKSADGVPHDKQKKTLKDDEIVSGPSVGRRSVLAALGAGTATLAAGVRPASAQITDSDGGACADPGGRGRGRTGVTDSDGGAFADPVGNGRFTGWTDSDFGSCSDPAGQGRGTRASGGGGGGGGRASGPTDSDGGAYADPVGQGRTSHPSAFRRWMAAPGPIRRAAGGGAAALPTATRAPTFATRAAAAGAAGRLEPFEGGGPAA